MNILLIGKNGQVGYELERCLQGLGNIIAVDRKRMDLTNPDQIREVIHAVKPKLILNAAAYTSVDLAESEPELAMRINALAPQIIAEESKRLGAVMIHYSTDYVFDGSKVDPYTEDDLTCPINVYGRTKREGELAIEATGVTHLILRTSWVYGMRGANFLRTVLQLTETSEELRIVRDQQGSPTWCRTVAESTAHIVAQSRATLDSQDWWGQRSGTYHLAAQGHTSRFAFAEAIIMHPAVRKKPVVVPIVTGDFRVAARRPLNSVLDCSRFISMFGCLPDWKTGLQLCLE
ncbi:MAG TPA: dTDP-4-dehydrorhamnose reductase [Noviherbaspirillum sp.]|nr:dTDP-4-dehydrorhamnose reductase [Noviherbaspirillum sp.]